MFLGHDGRNSLKTIWKHPIKITDTQDVFMPVGSRLLSVQQQYGQWQSWWEVPDTEAPAMRTTVSVIGTGNPVTHDPGRYVCTAQEFDLPFCWHFYTDDGAKS